ncbi:MAG: N-6 DNA methylase [Phycisphaerae bacterium]|nr:N-6 DNA methylase [Phycisphaerae bacterium]
MAKAGITSNERSWTIDVISEINTYSSKRRRAIHRAGGEHTISGGQALFPDVLLFGDPEGALVLQGWELKMPDTPVGDPDLLANAMAKAERLGLKSFLVWNVREAVLHCRTDEGHFLPSLQYGPIDITTRQDVSRGKEQWLGLLYKILADLNDFFEKRPQVGIALPDVLQDSLFAEFLTVFTPSYAASLDSARRKKSQFRAEVDIWWAANRQDHPELNATQALARGNILNWLNKFIFAHCLKPFRTEALQIDSITTETTVSQAQRVLGVITEKCDFMAVFQTMLGQEYVDPKTWRSLGDFNLLLANARLEAVAPPLLARTLAAVVDRARRKTAGQFATPLPLAELLARITVEDINGIILDPCCGTGTIIRTVYDWKCQEAIEPCDAVGQIWASDKFTFPLQLATMALANPAAIGVPLRIFCCDALELTAGRPIRLTDPNTGRPITAKLPAVDCIVSNLPFVRFETLGRPHAGGEKLGVNQAFEEPDLDSKSDLFAHLINSFPKVLRAGARVGVIVANSWMGTQWGLQFRRQLDRNFHLRSVIASASVRWFSPAAVVANILVLEQRDSQKASEEEETNFISISEPMEQWEQSSGGIKELASQIVLGKASSGNRLQIHSLAKRQTTELESLGLQWTALFADLGFIQIVKPFLIPAKAYFNINHGERRGWDDLFFPPSEAQIEPQFTRPVLKNSRQLRKLTATADAKAFCCSLSLDELGKQGCRAALKWIKRFEHQVNDVGRPLPDALHRPNCRWYEMKPSTMADLAISLNPDSRLCVFRLAERAFVNQRLIRFTVRSKTRVDMDLLHALMNSSLGMFFIEASGFGRGLGVLDLNATKLAKGFHILNPDNLDAPAAANVKHAFATLLQREADELPQELARADRQAFDACVAKAFGFSEAEPQIRSTLEFLYKMRKAARP